MKAISLFFTVSCLYALYYIFKKNEEEVLSWEIGALALSSLNALLALYFYSPDYFFAAGFGNKRGMRIWFFISIGLYLYGWRNSVIENPSFDEKEREKKYKDWKWALFGYGIMLFSKYILPILLEIILP